MNETSGGSLGTGNLDAHLSRLEGEVFIAGGCMFDKDGAVKARLVCMYMASRRPYLILEKDGEFTLKTVRDAMTGPPDFDREWGVILEEMRRLRLK
ncbi:MAG: hypothetical protein V3W28_06535 [Thermoplasmata archaeon]